MIFLPAFFVGICVKIGSQLASIWIQFNYTGTSSFEQTDEVPYFVFHFPILFTSIWKLDDVLTVVFSLITSCRMASTEGFGNYAVPLVSTRVLRLSIWLFEFQFYMLPFKKSMMFQRLHPLKRFFWSLKYGSRSPRTFLTIQSFNFWLNSKKGTFPSFITKIVYFELSKKFFPWSLVKRVCLQICWVNWIP